MTAPIYIEELTGMAFVLVVGGRFDMGDGFGDGFPDELPVHDVELPDFHMGQFPVTQGEWFRVMDHNPAMFKKGERYPVEMVSWDLAQAFIRCLNERTGDHFRLPSEAEWEYAARGGGLRQKWAGTSDLTKLGVFAWYDKNANGRTHPVGLKRPNELGLYDMSGDVHEWNEDIYHKDAYLRHGGFNPLCLETGAYRSFRGGSWKRHPEGLRCSRRMGGLPNQGFGTFGLRLVKSVFS